MRRFRGWFAAVPVAAVAGLVAFSSEGAHAKVGSHDEQSAAAPGAGHPVLIARGGFASASVVGPDAVFDAMLGSRATGDTIIYRVCKDLTICYLDVPARQPVVIATPPTATIVSAASTPIVPPAPEVAVGPSLLWGGLGLPFALLGFFLPGDRPGEGAGGGGVPVISPPSAPAGPDLPVTPPPPPPQDCFCPAPLAQRSAR